MRDLRDTMASCFEQVAFFFAGGDPRLQESYDRRAAYLDQQSYAREDLAEALTDYHKRLGAPSQTLERITDFRNGKALAVVTGQQAGLFTGPLYTLYKALTVIRLAEEQSIKLARPVAPVFWIAGEDHDWAEIREAVFLTEEGEPVSCTLPGEGKGLPVGKLPVPSWEELEPQVGAVLPPGRFREQVLETLRELTFKAANLTDWFALILQSLVREYGLIFFDPLQPRFKQLARSVYRRILAQPAEIREAVRLQTEKLKELGYSAQIELTGEEACIFLEVPERRALMWNGSDFYLRGQAGKLTFAEISEMLEGEPGRFSPSVVTRPIVQECLLPVLAYVAGPGELNYWAQLGGVFDRFGLRMPILYPRLSVAVLTPAWQKIMDSEGISFASTRNGLAAHKERCVREQDAFDIDGRFAAAEHSIRQLYDNLAPLAGIHANIPVLLEQNEDKVRGQLNYLKDKVWQAQRKRCEQSLKRIQKLENALFPLATQQERILNPFSFIVRYGLDFVRQVAELPLAEDFQEQVLNVE